MSFLQLPKQFLRDRALGSPVIEANKNLVLAELEGPGCIQHIFMAIRPIPLFNRQIILQIYWDEETNPSIECPLGDFFGLCHGLPYYEINSRYLSVKGQSGLNSYFPMPFAKSARIEVKAGPIKPVSLFFEIDWYRYSREELKESQRFHVKWRREFPTEAYGQEYLILDAIGEGRLMGFVYGVHLYDDRNRWSHGGAENIYIDGESEPVFIRGAGGEDTFGASYGGALHTPDSHLYTGMPYYVHEDVGQTRPAQRVAAYRFYEEDAIPFQHSLQFRFGCMANDICSTAYWYQNEPHHEFFKMPPWNKTLPGTELRRGECDISRASSGEWWLCGPFENKDNQGMKDSLPPEQEFASEATYDGRFKEGSLWLENLEQGKKHYAHWIRRQAVSGFIDFNHVFFPQTRGCSTCWPAVAYALTWLKVERASEVYLNIAWDDELSLWVNDDQVVDRKLHKFFRKSKFPVKFHAGRNRILLKLSNSKGTTWGAWCYAFWADTSDATKLKPSITTSEL